MKTRNVDLVRPDNEAYRKQSAHHAQKTRKLRDTLDPGLLQRLSDPIEVLLRRWLSRRISLTERRIVRYERLQRTRDYDLRFKEIDAVEAADAPETVEADRTSSPTNENPDEIRPRRLIEIKCSSNAGTLSSAGSQLRKALRPIQTRWQQPVYRHAILVAVVPDVMDLRNEPVPLGEFDPSIPEAAHPQDLLTTYLSAEDLWNWGTDVGLLGDDGPIEVAPDLLNEAQEEARETAERRQRRKELKDEGVPREQWPAELKTDQSEDVPDSETVRYGEPDTKDRSSMADALRNALKEEED